MQVNRASVQIARVYDEDLVNPLSMLCRLGRLLPVLGLPLAALAVGLPLAPREGLALCPEPVETCE